MMDILSVKRTPPSEPCNLRAKPAADVKSVIGDNTFAALISWEKVTEPEIPTNQEGDIHTREDVPTNKAVLSGKGYQDEKTAPQSEYQKPTKDERISDTSLINGNEFAIQLNKAIRPLRDSMALSSTGKNRPDNLPQQNNARVAYLKPSKTNTTEHLSVLTVTKQAGETPTGKEAAFQTKKAGHPVGAGGTGLQSQAANHHKTGLANTVAESLHLLRTPVAAYQGVRRKTTDSRNKQGSPQTLEAANWDLVKQNNSRVPRNMLRPAERLSATQHLATPISQPSLLSSNDFVSRETFLLRDFFGTQAEQLRNSGLTEGNLRQTLKTERLDLTGDRTPRFEAVKNTVSQRPEGLPQLARQFDDILQRARIQLFEDGRANLTTRLNPRELGTLTVNLALADGVVSARFIVSNETIQRELTAHIENIRQQLAQEGLALADFSVHVGGQPLQQRNDSVAEYLPNGKVMPKSGDAYHEASSVVPATREGLYA